MLWVVTTWRVRWFIFSQREHRARTVLWWKHAVALLIMQRVWKSRNHEDQENALSVILQTCWPMQALVNPCWPKSRPAVSALVSLGSLLSEWRAIGIRKGRRLKTGSFQAKYLRRIVGIVWEGILFLFEQLVVTVFHLQPTVCSRNIELQRSIGVVYCILYTVLITWGSLLDLSVINHMIVKTDGSSIINHCNPLMLLLIVSP